MISLDQLRKIKERMRGEVAIRKGKASTKVVVSMGTCGIAAGARTVLGALVEEVNAQGLVDDVTVTQSGCVGICEHEPVVEVYTPNGSKTTYIDMTAEKAKEVVEKHLKGGKAVKKYTLSESK